MAFDDDLLKAGRATLRFWESPIHFVVLGRSGRPEKEVNLGACRAAGIPVLHRSSGGGTVLQGPGCLNYALVLPLAGCPGLANVGASYQILLRQIAGALRLPGLEVCGTDILLDGRKVSGNAQRRTKGWLLHHGTILHGLDLQLMERLLLEPARQPAHRRGRPHREFVAPLDVDANQLKSRMASLSKDPAWRFLY